MLYVPPISDYKPFYIQFGSGTAQDLLSVYSIIVKAHDYPSAWKIKEPYKNDWKDEDGDDEYIPANGFKIAAFTFHLECAMFARGVSDAAAIAELNEGIRAFQSAMQSGAFSTYDAYTGFGFQNVRISEIQNVSSDSYRVEDNQARVIFSVTLKVNDPVTRMVLDTNSQSSTYGQIIEAS